MASAARKTTREQRKTTLDDASGVSSRRSIRAGATPGLVLVFSVDGPRCDVFPLEGAELEVRRDETPGAPLCDPQMSRRHARVRYDGGLWEVEDLGSRNGTSVDGEPLTGRRAGKDLRIVRTGSSVFLLKDDVEPFRAGVSTAGGTILGPALLHVWELITRSVRYKSTLHITGESGAGKERAARAFHSLGPRSRGPFIPVNCAAIPEGLAERLLFGARKGAYSGAAADADGYVQAAHGGVLFLDEVAELDLGVQAKLLRVLETKEVLPLGASRAVAVDFALVSATHKDLRAQVAARKLREDLFFRIARPAVRIPPLRERLEEIPYLADAALREMEAAGPGAEDSAPIRAHASLIEVCLMRAWPGNVRELYAEIQAAAQEARSSASASVQARHLAPSAGQSFSHVDAGRPAAPAPEPAPAPAQSSPRAAWRAPAAAKRTSSLPADEAIEQALLREGGNVARAAQALGVHRTQLRRWIARREADSSPQG